MERHEIQSVFVRAKCVICEAASEELGVARFSLLFDSQDLPKAKAAYRWIFENTKAVGFTIVADLKGDFLTFNMSYKSLRIFSAKNMPSVNVKEFSDSVQGHGFAFTLYEYVSQVAPMEVYIYSKDSKQLPQVVSCAEFRLDPQAFETQ